MTDSKLDLAQKESCAKQMYYYQKENFFEYVKKNLPMTINSFSIHKIKKESDKIKFMVKHSYTNYFSLTSWYNYFFGQYTNLKWVSEKDIFKNDIIFESEIFLF